MRKRQSFSLIIGLVLILILVIYPKADDRPPQNPPTNGEHVILLHGLVRSAHTMESMAQALRAVGYQTTIVDYPSRKKPIQKLTDEHLAPTVRRCQLTGATKIHFVSHSLGGILVRDFLARNKLPELGRVVMLAPPNQGSEVVDKIGHWDTFKSLNGPAGKQLGTGDSSVPRTLGPVTYPVGIIAGDRSINPINSLIIPGPDDGKVSIEHSKVEGMTEHIVIHRSHPMIMKRKDAIALTIRFLQHGTFKLKSTAE